MIGASANFVDAADIPLAAEHQVIRAVLVDLGAQPAWAHLEGHRPTFFSPVFNTCMFLAEQSARYSMSRTVARSILIAGRKTSVASGGSVLGGTAGNCTQTSRDLVSSDEHYRCATSPWESIICTSVVRAGVLSQPDWRHQRPQSSSASRLTAGAAGFLYLSQSGDRPDR